MSYHQENTVRLVITILIISILMRYFVGGAFMLLSNGVLQIFTKVAVGLISLFPNHLIPIPFRFQDSRSVKRLNGQSTSYDGVELGRLRSAVSDKFQRGCSENIKRFTGLLRSFSLARFTRKKILDPQGSFLLKWNKIIILTCSLDLFLDPLFFYIPIVNGDRKCLDLDRGLELTACILRSFTDIFYLIHIIFRFRTGFIVRSSPEFGRGVLVENSWEIARRYLSSLFVIDILAVLPLPQIVIMIIVPKLNCPRSLNTTDLLKFVVLLQYIPRVFRTGPLIREFATTTNICTETLWTAAAFNLFRYLHASYVFGAFWYLLSVERETTCWLRTCKAQSGCRKASFDCDGDHKQFSETFSLSCPIQTPNATIFYFGIFLDALQSDIVESKDLPHKLFYCFWWGLQNLSSVGQNLKTSTYGWEICFAVFICISSLVLFSSLIVTMLQTYVQSLTLRLEEMKVKRRDTEYWMYHRLLPQSLRKRIRRHQQYKWKETRGVDEDDLVRNLPKDIRRDVKRHLCLASLKRVPMFEKMDDQLLDTMCDRLKPVLYTENSYIVREGDPLEEMLFVMHGKLLTVTTNGGRTGFLNTNFLKAGDFCGEKLLTWALDPHSSSSLPISTITVQALSEVEVFTLMADDLKFVASQFRRQHSKQLHHTVRFYSQQWRTWAACFIQAAWRRHARKKQDVRLQNLGATRHICIDICE